MQYNFLLSAEETETIIVGLNELPAKFSLQLINKITKTVNEQNQADAERQRATLKAKCLEELSKAPAPTEETKAEIQKTDVQTNKLTKYLGNVIPKGKNA